MTVCQCESWVLAGDRRSVFIAFPLILAMDVHLYTGYHTVVEWSPLPPYLTSQFSCSLVSFHHHLYCGDIAQSLFRRNRIWCALVSEGLSLVNPTHLSSSDVSSSSNLRASRAAVFSFHWPMLLCTCRSSSSLSLSCRLKESITPPSGAPLSWERFRILSSSMCSFSTDSVKHISQCVCVCVWKYVGLASHTCYL